MGHGAEAHPRRLDRVHLHDAGLLQMRGRAHAELLGVLTVDLHEIRPLGAELQAVDAIRVRPLDVRMRLLRGLRDAFAPSGAGTLIVEDARRDDFVLGAAFLLLDREHVVSERHAANRRHSVRHPQLVGVLGVGVLRRAPRVHVEIDEAGHHVHPGGVDLVVRFRRAIGPHRHTRRPRVANRGDAVVFDDDVDGSSRRTAGAVDQHRAAHHHRLVGTESLTLGAVRRGPQRLALQWTLIQRLRRGLRAERDGEDRDEREPDCRKCDASTAEHGASGSKFTRYTGV
jgi:hypothetical protein